MRFFYKYVVQWIKQINERELYMSEYHEEIKRLAQEFESCRKILLALGDENRQNLKLEMKQMEKRTL